MNSEERIAAILADPEVRRIGALIEEEESRGGHETRTPHWGLTPDGAPVAWIGCAPDDD